MRLTGSALGGGTASGDNAAVRCAAMVAITVLVGCGGGGATGPGTGGSCAKKTACGGDVVGTWTIASQCVDVSVDAICAGGKLDPAGLTVTGAVTYNSDLTYTLTTQTKGTQKLTLPKACLMMGGMTSSCAEVGSSITDTLYTGVTATVCSNLSVDCQCSVDVDTQQTTESGTYAATGTVITHTPANGTPHDSDYCVSGAELDEMPVQADTSGFTVFTRQ